MNSETKEQRRARYLRNKQKEKESSRKLRYKNMGIDPVEGNQLWLAAKKCQSCGVRFDKTTRQKVLDHCHNSLQIRGVICSWCNRGIGMLGDTVTGVLNALKYLLKDY